VRLYAFFLLRIKYVFMSILFNLLQSAHQVIWHQALLAFAQRYKFEFDDAQRERLKQLVRIQQHHQITIEVKRELIAALSTGSKTSSNDDAMSITNHRA
jgi:uncharacterized protein YvpB